MLHQSPATAQQSALYAEPYRPAFHYTPERNWTNEPNGLVYRDGVYHLFYQANPFNNQFGNQTWGHATSPDLVNWSQQPAAITPGGGKVIYSGSAVVDANNTAGFGAGALVAAYTGFDPVTGVQDQRLAYSLDGLAFTKYSPPVIPRLPGVEGIESRDPKVFWHEATSAWRMVLSHGGQNKVSLWSSPDLRSWSRTQDFVAPQISGASGWEVPDLFPLAVDGNTNDVKWVMSITPSTGSPAGGNGVMYFLGDYNGLTFTRDAALQPLNQSLWADHGRDFDGQQSWSNSPDGRTVWTSVMQSYGESTPTSPWRGQMAFPRELSLGTTSQGVRLLQQPIDEIASLRIPGAETILNNVVIGANSDPLDQFNLQHDAYEIVATFDPQTASSVGFRVREGAGGQQTTIGWNRLIERLLVDRSASGNTSFASGGGGLHLAPLAPAADGSITIRALIDRSSVEVFGGQGEAVISDLIFPDPASRGLSLFSTGGDATVRSLAVYPLRTIWPETSASSPGTPAVARWGMAATPTAAIQDGAYPAVIDSRTRLGEGTKPGAVNTLYEPTAAVDNLYFSRSGPGGLPISSQTAPASMYANGNSGGSASYNAGAIALEDGALYLPRDLYGDEAAFTGAFSVEMVFRTAGDKSGSGLMQLMLAGENQFRFGLILNEGGPGNLRFALNDKAETIPILDTNSFSSRNFADGQWHYLLATFDPAVSVRGQMRVVVTSEDGSVVEATSLVSAAFDGLPVSSGDGNLLIGRNQFAVSGDDRTFQGFIDEVQLTRGIVPAGLRLGAIAGADLGGDFNGDGAVDAADYTLWRDLSGRSGASLAADADGNGIVDSIDYDIWKSNYGLRDAGLTGAVVPEPAAALLAFAMAITIGESRRSAANYGFG